MGERFRIMATCLAPSLAGCGLLPLIGLSSAGWAVTGEWSAWCCYETGWFGQDLWCLRVEEDSAEDISGRFAVGSYNDPPHPDGPFVRFGTVSGERSGSRVRMQFKWDRSQVVVPYEGTQTDSMTIATRAFTTHDTSLSNWIFDLRRVPEESDRCGDVWEKEPDS